MADDRLLEALGIKVSRSDDDEPVTVVFASRQAVEAVRQSLKDEAEPPNTDENDSIREPD